LSDVDGGNEATLRARDLVSQDEPGHAKADLSHIYDCPDPRAYFDTLGELDYDIPQRAQPVVQALLKARSRPDTAEPTRVLDVCCSYGINAALLRCEVTLAQMYERYASTPAEVTSAQLAESDAEFYAGRLREAPARVVGLDIAEQAVGYGCRVGLLDRGWAEDLEARDPSPALSDELTRTDLILTTGGVGYVTQRTFDRLLAPPRQGPKPWVAAWVLRMFAYDEISAVLAKHGLRTEQLHGTSFPQRRFANDRERDVALREIAARGLDTTGLESDGRYYADLYLSRPEADIEQVPLRELLRDVAPEA